MDSTQRGDWRIRDKIVSTIPYSIPLQGVLLVLEEDVIAVVVMVAVVMVSSSSSFAGGVGGGENKWHTAQICSATSCVVPLSNPVSETFDRWQIRQSRTISDRK